MKRAFGEVGSFSVILLSQPSLLHSEDLLGVLVPSMINFYPKETFVIPERFTIRQIRFVFVIAATKKSAVATGMISYCDSKSKFTELTMEL